MNELEQINKEILDLVSTFNDDDQLHISYSINYQAEQNADRKNWKKTITKFNKLLKLVEKRAELTKEL